MFFILFSLLYICVLYFLYLLRILFFGSEFVPRGNFYFLSNQYATRDHMTAMYSAILSLGHMEEELSTACRAAADALEILSNLQPGFTRNVIPRINSSTAVSVSQANSGEHQVNDEELQANESRCRSILDDATLEQCYSSSACHSLPDSWLEPS